MNISAEGLSLIKKFEGCELKAYRCAANVLTIGYGSTKGVTEDMEITQEEAESLLQHQFDAMVSWVFNLGSGNLSSSTLLKKLNNSEYDEVPAQIRRWNKAGGKVLDGLIRRREAEAKMFMNEDWYEV